MLHGWDWFPTGTWVSVYTTRLVLEPTHSRVSYVLKLKWTNDIRRSGYLLPRFLGAFIGQVLV